MRATLWQCSGFRLTPGAGLGLPDLPAGPMLSVVPVRARTRNSEERDAKGAEARRATVLSGCGVLRQRTRSGWSAVEGARVAGFGSAMRSPAFRHSVVSILGPHGLVCVGDAAFGGGDVVLDDG